MDHPNPYYNPKYAVGDPEFWAAWRAFFEPLMVQPTPTQNILALLMVFIFVTLLGLFARGADK